MKHRKSNISLKISDNHLENSLGTLATCIEPDIDTLESQKQGEISHYFYIFVALIFVLIKKCMKNVLQLISYIIYFIHGPRKFLLVQCSPGKPKGWTRM